MDVLERLRTGAPRAFAGTPVRFAYLYGSQATGTARPDSDVDVAVLLDDAVPPEQRLTVALGLADALERETGVRPLDAVLVLNDARLRLRGRVVQEGKVVYSRDEPARVAYESRTFREYADFEPSARELDAELLRAIAKGRR